MDVAAWQRRLSETFLNGNPAHIELLSVLKSENLFKGQVLEQANGHLVLLHSLQAFILETFGECASQANSPCLVGKQYYSVFLFDILLAFRTIRSCELAFLNGYPNASYVLLRGLRDRVIFLAAIGRGLTSFRRLHGLDPNLTLAEMEAKRDEIKRRAEAEERRVHNEMFRRAPDLAAHREALLIWDRMFNPEVHGSLYSGSHLFLKWYREGVLPIRPQYDDLVNIYINRLGDLGWMLVRLLSLLQPSPSTFSAPWAERWAILDDSFLVYNRGLITVDKPGLTGIANGIRSLIDARFGFTPQKSSYQSCLEENEPS